ncbi:MAG: DUF615 domain-containing protein [Betaproteobacteria bacterium]|jgi:ribosome-associated protein|nr:DUF615 domain-containing protein [Betaproteobacteria bacterium]
MSRKLKKGYFVKGVFVAEGSEMDIQLKAELKGTEFSSRTDLKRESDALQKLGKDLLDLRADALAKLGFTEKLLDAMAEAKRITNFEGKRRQMQFIGKLMRLQAPEVLDAAREALAEQHHGSAALTLALHQAEQWRTELLASDDAVSRWMEAFPATDSQQLRALVRQARKDNPPDKTAESQGLAPRHSKAYRDIYQLVREHLEGGSADESEESDE